MDSKDDVTLQVLIDIREEIRGTNKRVDGLQEEVKQTNQRIDNLRGELSQRITHSEIRVATAITDLHGSINDVKTMLGEQLELRDRVANCERDIAELKRKNKPE